MIVLEKRQHPSLWMGYLSPLLSIALTFVVAAMVVVMVMMKKNKIMMMSFAGDDYCYDSLCVICHC